MQRSVLCGTQQDAAQCAVWYTTGCSAVCCMVHNSQRFVVYCVSDGYRQGGSKKLWVTREHKQ